jgi:toxin secretion/phage lysis holin
MKEFIIKAPEYIISGILTLGAFLFGSFNGLMVALVTVIFIDLATGVGVAVVYRKLSSKIGSKGFVKKFLMLLIVALAHILDTYVVGGGDKLQIAATLYYILNEGVSILENCAELGLPVPTKLTDVLSQLREDGKKNVGNEPSVGEELADAVKDATDTIAENVLENIGIAANAPDKPNADVNVADGNAAGITDRKAALTGNSAEDPKSVSTPVSPAATS